MNIKIKNKTIGKNSVFVVAEAGINHNGSLRIAKKLVSKAKEIEADAVKFQTFQATDLTASHSKFFKIFKKVELSKSDFEEISDHAKSEGIIFFSTPFSNESADLLKSLNVPAFKISSGDLTNLPLIKHVAKKKKPIILSTGMSNLNEIKQAVATVKLSGNKKIILLHSVAAYPTPYQEVNLNAITLLQKKFSYPTGFSDNGKDLLVPLIAVAKGAKIIEKHFTINNKLEGPDQKLSANPTEFSLLIKQIRQIEYMFGKNEKFCQPSELSNKINARRSITAKISIEKGTKITSQMIALKRPSSGIQPKFFNKVLGKITKKNIPKDQSLRWKDLK